MTDKVTPREASASKNLLKKTSFLGLPFKSVTAVRTYVKSFSISKRHFGQFNPPSQLLTYPQPPEGLCLGPKGEPQPPELCLWVAGKG